MGAGQEALWLGFGLVQAVGSGALGEEVGGGESGRYVG